ADQCSIYTYMAGGGCSLPGKAMVLMPGAGYEGVTRFVLDVMTSYGLNACPPLLVGVGVATSVETAALLSKQVDWIEAPAPDAIDQIKSQGFHLYANTQPHLWPWQFSFEKGSPWQDIRVRKAANLCLNRAELKSYLGGYMTEAT
ncbi:fumarate hydratase, partial [Klebsiella pneumoniae]|uniref:fumarate hydratase n=1 Tax=Klebsiella pneumoniae TaxID=573 RepID=UPI001F5EC683